MTEWIGLLVSDFFTSSVQDYQMMVAHYNQTSWPLQFISLIVGLWLLWLLHQPRRSGTINWLISASWLWCGFSFYLMHWQLLIPDAQIWGWLYILQGLLLALFSKKITYFHPYQNTISKWGYGGLIVCLLVPTLSASISGENWWQIPFVGLMPTPTALSTLALLLMGRGPWRILLALIPTAWCLVAGALAHWQGQLWWLIPPALGVLAYVFILLKLKGKSVTYNN